MTENLINIDAAIKAAANGDAEAQFMLGYAYRWGKGVERKWSKAAILLHKAMEQGHAEAKNTLKELLNQTWETSESKIYQAFVESLEKKTKPTANQEIKRICKSCGEQLADGSSFCDECGADCDEEAPTRYCRYCDEPLTTNEIICHKCGEEYGGKENICPNDQTVTTKKNCPKCGKLLGINIIQSNQNEKTIDEILAKLDALIGLKDVKKTVRDIIQKIKFEKKRAEMTGKETNIEGNHIVLTGNPGTGKTLIARILADLFAASGVLSSNVFIATQGFDLKGAYVGQSKDIVNKYCDEAMGGVLIIDEAYALTNEKGPVDEFAKEALDVLLARLENDKKKFICIAAGYHKEMETFLDKSNPGMRRRFAHFINLPDYTADELIEIFEQYVKKDGFTLSASAKEKAREIIKKMSANKGPVFGNAREMRMLFEKAMSKQAQRICNLPEDQQEEAMLIIEAEDISL